MLKKILTNPSNYVAIFSGIVYGLAAQFFSRINLPGEFFSDAYYVMTLGFVFVLPFVIGYVSISRAAPEARRSWVYRILAPVFSITVSLFLALMIGWEGSICLVLAAVVYYPLAILGGIAAGIYYTRSDNNRLKSGILAALLILPLVSGAVEEKIGIKAEQSRVANSILIRATPAEIWQQIIRVPEITEPLDGFFYKLGFPKPVEATLSYEGVGAVRVASFERGLTFIETVDVWEPERKLSFAIKADPESTPLTTLDAHVTVGGRYFDVLRGTYEIVPVSEGVSELKLSSHIRVSTHFNFYAGWWGDFLMYDIQKTILKVIKSRAEKG